MCLASTQSCCSLPSHAVPCLAAGNLRPAGVGVGGRCIINSRGLACCPWGAGRALREAAAELEGRAAPGRKAHLPPSHVPTPAGSQRSLRCLYPCSDACTQTHTKKHRNTQRPRPGGARIRTHRLTDTPSRLPSEPFLDRLHFSPCLSPFSPPFKTICETLCTRPPSWCYGHQRIKTERLEG